MLSPIIHEILVPIFKMLIEELLCSESFLAEATMPFINIKMNLMLLLLPKHVIIRTEPTFAWELIILFFYEGHQILIDCFPCCTAPFSRAMHLMCVWICLKKCSGSSSFTEFLARSGHEENAAGAEQCGEEEGCRESSATKHSRSFRILFGDSLGFSKARSRQRWGRSGGAGPKLED
uniref:Uncharacterized protein n=1 Tax=Arundo donax TaxID=35708 RepID=A0A0A9D0N5_ARUDO